MDNTEQTTTIPVDENTSTVPHELDSTERVDTLNVKLDEQGQIIKDTPQEVIHIEEVNQTESENVDNIAKNEVISGEIVEVKEKNVGGRPSKYNEEMLMKAKDYYDLCSGKKDGKKRMPFIEELAMECSVNDETITEWTKIDGNEEYSATIKNIKNLQKLRTVQQGYGAKNPTFAIFMLKANHGMMETEKRVLAGEKNSEPIQVSSINYRDATKPGIDEGVRQQIIEEGTE